MIELLHKRLADANVPIDGVAKIAVGNYRIDYRPEATAGDISLGNAIAAAFNEAQEQTDLDGLRARVLAIVNTTVGVDIDDLTNLQIKALIAVLLWKVGAIDNTGAVKAVNEWG